MAAISRGEVLGLRGKTKKQKMKNKALTNDCLKRIPQVRQLLVGERFWAYGAKPKNKKYI